MGGFRPEERLEALSCSPTINNVSDTTCQPFARAAQQGRREANSDGRGGAAQQTTGPRLRSLTSQQSRVHPTYP